ncbi:MAG TPA: hemerythrin domain-containing protein [Segeticoccus sp.]|uniref:hemerythrin domain-containing protein n=1 Tax=Segeticoccus sp. TaxID=2706531 RepID=UPI002D7ED689|nr:hemerythrin domain-containing protein [Segeticoccus sp.]HET8599079.1 hemerythrin domain-containing protein [Segeticoccus sp.]
MCSYCGCRSISVIGRYSAEHEELVNASGALVRAVKGADSASVRAAATTLAHRLDEHTGSEERGLFAELRLDPDFTEHVDSLCAEHTDIHQLLEAIDCGEVALAQRFDDALRRHIDREENGLFPAAAVALDGPAWERVVALA